MSRSRYRIFETAYPYFVTSTIVGWLPVFTRVETKDLILDSWRYLQRERGLKLFAYVILENHLHAIVSAPELGAVLQQFKSYTARRIIDTLKHRAATVLLRQLRSNKPDYKKDSEFQVWQEGNHPQQVQNDDMMWQKLEYIHNNPLERGYVDDPCHWRYSSARNYARQGGLIDIVTDWM